MVAEKLRFRQGAGRLCLDFLRTLRYRGSTDAVEELADPAALADWTRQFQPDLTVGPLPAQAVVEEAHALREAVHAMIQSARGDAGLAACPDQARRRVNRVAARAVPAPALTPAGHLRWQSDDPV